MALGLGGILSGIGGISSLLGGRSASNAQKEQSRRQSQLLDMQNQNFRQAQPFYGQALQQAANYAGLNGDLRGGDGQFSLGGNWGNREDQLRLQQAEEDIRRRQQAAGNQFRFQAQRSGLNEGAMGAGLARLAGQGQQDYGQFRRGLAIQAGQEQERRMQALQQLIAQGFGQGSQAVAGYGQQAGMYGQQAQSAFGGLGNIIQQMEYMKMLRNLPSGGVDLRSGNYGGGLGGI
jgi:hypothetical protein